MSSENISYPGEIEIISATIFTANGSTIGISGIIADLTLYEDLFSNTMSGYVLIEDSLDLINSLPLIGQELLELHLKTPTLSTEIKKTFYIYKLQGRTSKKRVQNYMLNFCSKELIISSNTKVSKSYGTTKPDKTLNLISDVVKDIFTNNKYLASNPNNLIVENTKNVYPFIATFWSPLETINWLTAKSLNERDVPNYLFYETNQSFEYKSVDSLMRAPYKREYIHSDIDANTINGSHGDIENKYKVVQSIDTPVTFDHLRNTNAGMFSSKLYTFDVTTREANATTYDYLKDFDNSSHLNGPGLSSSPLKNENLIKRKLSSLYFIDKNNYLQGSFSPQPYKWTFLQRNSLLEQMTAFRLCIKVIGRTDIKVGDTIKFTMNKFKEISEEDIPTIESGYYTGIYLITAIRHQIINGTHSMYMEIISDSFADKTIVNTKKI